MGTQSRGRGVIHLLPTHIAIYITLGHDTSVTPLALCFTIFKSKQALRIVPKAYKRKLDTRDVIAGELARTHVFNKVG